MMSPVTDLTPDRLERGASSLFMFGALFLLVMILIAVLVRQNYFSQTTTLYFFTDNAQGLNVGMAVKFAGFKVGSIEKISIDPQAQVKVTMSLNNDYINLISRDAKARLIKEGLIGESVVVIVSPESKTRQVAQDDVLLFERARDIAELADNLVGQVQPILEDVKKITAAVSDADQDIRESLRNVNKISGGLLRNVDKISGELLKITRQVNTLASNGNSTLTVVHHSASTLDAALPKIISGVEENLINLQATTAEIRKMTSPPSGQIPILLKNSNVLIRDSKDIVGAAKHTWPVSAMLPEAEQLMLPLDGYEEPYSGPVLK